VGPIAGVDASENRHLFSLTGTIKAQFLNNSAHSLVTILAELSQLVMSVK